MKAIPEIRRVDGIDTLFVDDAPFLVLGGEIHNSSASSLAYMQDKVWPALVGLHMNTVLLAVTWELVEPEEGVFDFSLIDGLLGQARSNGMRLILLWFGLWKNSESTYVPAWMKEDARTYFRARKESGEAIPTISPLCEAAIEKDAHALSQVMRHLRLVDEPTRTVIAIQVENEIGLLGTDRDYSEVATQAFRARVPQAVAAAWSGEGDWRTCFPDQAEESFMAYHFANAIERITARARAEYPLPCYANAWLRQFPWYPGSYPIGGPVASVHRMWRLVAPSLFCLAPDIYVPYAVQVMEEYAADGNPLFIPEIRKDIVTASYAFYAFLHHHAIGYSPFGIEELVLDESEIDKPPAELMAALNIDPSAFQTAGSHDCLAAVYGFLEAFSPLYYRYRNTPGMHVFIKKNETDFGAFVEDGDAQFLVHYAPKQPGKPLPVGMIQRLAPHRYLVVGMMCTVKVHSRPGAPRRMEILRLAEGVVEAGNWVEGRLLNGDERMGIRMGDRLRCFMLDVMETD